MNRVMSVGIQGVIERGIRLARRKEYSEAIKAFEEHIGFMQHPLALSYYSLSLAVAEREFERALSLCTGAVEREFYNPEVYLNLGRIHLCRGYKTSAIKAFKEGLKYDASNSSIRAELRKLGSRKKLFLSFLPRNSSINRFFGLLTGKPA